MLPLVMDVPSLPELALQDLYLSQLLLGVLLAVLGVPLLLLKEEPPARQLLLELGDLLLPVTIGLVVVVVPLVFVPNVVVVLVPVNHLLRLLLLLLLVMGSSSSSCR